MSLPRPVRRNPRLQGYDYSQEGAYFVTICTHNRTNIFGNIRQNELILSPMGLIAFEDMQMIPSHYPTVELDCFVIMPNHIHSIIFLVEVELIPPVPLPQIMAGYKAGVSRRINALNHSTATVWQRSFHDHIIRNETELNRIREYVANNPSLWEQDTFYG